MIIRSIRRITADSFHNAFTGAAWFQGALYVGYRQGDAHVCDQGRLVVQRSRDGGVHFDTVTVARSDLDTRDAQLYAVGDRRLHLVGFEGTAAGMTRTRRSGTSWTENGLNWSPWTPYTGADGWVMWKPRWFQGRHYCPAYGRDPDTGRFVVAWFESDDGLAWSKQGVLCDDGNEAAVDFKADGAAAMLVRSGSEIGPMLARATPPYRQWDWVTLDLVMNNPMLWFVGNDLYIGGRWSPQAGANVSQLALFKIVNDQPELQFVMPSGPGFDCAYMSVAPWPGNRHRFAMAYYSNHIAPDDPAVNQWNHPDIFVADVVFDAPFIRLWRVSDLQPLPAGLEALTPPDPDRSDLGWETREAMPGAGSEYVPPDAFVDAHDRIGGRPGVVYFAGEFDGGDGREGMLHLGCDGPIRVWLNDALVFQGPGSNPAKVDAHSVPVKPRPGRNRLMIVLDSNHGKAWGIMARFEARA